MIPVFLLSLFGRFKWLKPLLIVVAVVGVVLLIAWAGATVRQWKYDSDELAVVKPQLEAYEAAQKAANDKVLEQAPIDAAAVKELVDTKAALEAEKLKTARAWGRVAVLKETINAETGCPVVRLSAGWGVCFAAAAAGDSADAQACQAAGGDGPVAAGPGDGGL
jgi:hypothetical protein